MACMSNSQPEWSPIPLLRMTSEIDLAYTCTTESIQKSYPNIILSISRVFPKNTAVESRALPDTLSSSCRVS